MDVLTATEIGPDGGSPALLQYCGVAMISDRPD